MEKNTDNNSVTEFAMGKLSYKVISFWEFYDQPLDLSYYLPL